MSPAGRRPGKPETRDAILEAARQSFAELGYDGTTIRAIGTAAGVDPALVHHFFGTKAALFAAAVDFPVSPRAVLPAIFDNDADHAGEQIVRFFLSMWEDPTSRRRLLAMVKSAVHYDAAAAMLREFLRREVIGTFVDALDTPDAELRATLVGSQLIGLAIVRYIVKVPPLATASTEALVAAYAPTIQRYVNGRVDATGPVVR
jgi:AcrR family transcriptional regulator